jgi:hypothetical protein
MTIIENEIGEIPCRVSIGYQTIPIFRPEEIDSMQVGYSSSPDGKALVNSA